MLLANRDVAQLGRALRSGRRGRKFKSCHPDLQVPFNQMEPFFMLSNYSSYTLLS